jgi:chromosome segregation ATPase
MAAGDFVKVAAAQLRRASQVLKQESSSMLAERERTARQLSSEITDHQLKLRVKETELNDPNKDDREKQRISREIQDLHRAIDTKQHRMNDASAQLANAANVKKSKATNLDGRAGDLESQAASL